MGVTAQSGDVSDPVAAPGRFGTGKIDGCGHPRILRLQDSDPDPLHFVERDLVACAAVEVGRVGQFVDTPHSRPIQSA